MSATRRWRGLAALLVDAVTHGSAAVERVQKETAARPFGVLEQIPSVAPLSKVVHAAHDGSVGAAHGAVRLAARVVGSAVDLAFDVAGATAALSKKSQYPGGRPPPGAPPPP